MRRITLWLFSTVAALVLLVSYRTSTGSPAAATPVAEAPLTGTTTEPAATDPPSPTPSTSPSPATSASPSAAASPSRSVARTYTGSVAQTRWGPVQVGITVSGGRITDVAVPLYPDGNHRDQEINAYALPILRQETVAAQSATIDAVSGATVTSDGYVESLQAALDAAHL
jgi:uncharacterized protein with FMN-binding domain